MILSSCLLPPCKKCFESKKLQKGFVADFSVMEIHPEVQEELGAGYWLLHLVDCANGHFLKSSL